MSKFLKLVLFFTLILSLTGCFGKSSSSDNDDNNNNNEYYSDGSYITYFSNQSNPSKAINIVVMGDGYIKEDLAKNGVYETEAKKLINGLFSKALFHSTRKISMLI